MAPRKGSVLTTHDIRLMFFWRDQCHCYDEEVGHCPLMITNEGQKGVCIKFAIKLIKSRKELSGSIKSDTDIRMALFWRNQCHIHNIVSKDCPLYLTKNGVNKCHALVRKLNKLRKKGGG